MAPMTRPKEEPAPKRRPDISEVYSPPRVTAMARAMGMRDGWALDLRTVDEEGRRWDFTKRERRMEALQL
eukprot:6617730-Lingulodinium_polyedra.AAC.1